MAPIPEKITYRIDEASKLTGLSRSFIYERMSRGELKSLKVGKTRLLLRSDLMEFLSPSPPRP
ncbi:helix-turn-helix domain-containing protein [Asticcacaulis sp. SL142]|uniref:excisionase family DNA-binding protein n=1 Tax=Asticcacaulis sp. SL142 TaxID=2995155 RepID=UPI00226D33AD|nr:helix-turn-helix domain-containing protein [Asticcacaulis sp. SL142]WAC49405.1 helix-turn-helix domain-containing protein [Asticcacaulis sp. SL142]